jgi:hypothetical protein
MESPPTILPLPGRQGTGLPGKVTTLILFLLTIQVKGSSSEQKQEQKPQSL